ncbi:MAG: heat shock protein HslVU, ATPase subunit HslU [Chloroflexi bacterium]|nr:heat shock protein HslVU, ATPase subunit HslU [Chloroflexota bacterium]
MAAETAAPATHRKRRRIDAMTPSEIVLELDRHIIGQGAAKRALAIALRNRYRRRQLASEDRRAIIPKNIMMIGPTGVGKTEMVRMVARMLEAPFLKVEATKYTEVGYVGRDVESIILDLVEDTVARLHDRRLQDVQTKAEKRATERLVDYVVAQAATGALKSATGRALVRVPDGLRAAAAAAPDNSEGRVEIDEMSRRRIGRMLRSEKLDNAMIEIEVTPDLDPYDAFWDYGTPESAQYSREAMPPPGIRSRPRSRVVCVRDAKRILAREESNKLVDFDAVVDEALERVEENGIVFIDEIDKIAGRGNESGADVSGEGVQRDLLPIIEGSVVMTRYGPVGSHRMLFIAAGSFTKVKPSDLIPELQGRFPLRVELGALGRTELEEILVRPEHSLCSQYQTLLATEKVELEFTPDGIAEMARVAWEVNQRVEDIGARRLHTVLEQTLEEISFSAPEMAGSTVSIDGAYVRERTASLVASEDLKRFIL